MDLGLTGKIAIVTGGSEGIGKAAAMAMADYGAEGATVAGTQAGLEATARADRQRVDRGLPTAAHRHKD